MNRGLMILVLGVTAGLVGGMALLSCDQPKAPRAKDEPTPTSDRPTTQQILAAKRVNRQLFGYQLRMDVPEVWESRKLGEATFLRGPTPGGYAMVNVWVVSATGRAGSLHYYSPEQLKIKMDLEQERYKNNPASYRAFEKRTMGEAQVLDATTVINADKAATTNPATPPTVQRMITLFAPDGDRFVCYKVSCELPVTQWEEDKDMLQEVLATLSYDPGIAPPKGRDDERAPGSPREKAMDDRLD